MTDSKKSKTQFNLTWLPKKTFEILAVIPWEEIKETRDKIVAEEGKSIAVKGFRKGKAPEKLIIEAIGPKKLLESILQKLIPEQYQQAITSFGLRPIVNPKIQLVSTKEDENWQIKYVSCEEPEVNLKNYKEELKKIKAGNSIWKPHDSPKNPKEEEEKKLNNIINWLLQNIKVEISDQLLEEEINRRLSSLLEQTQKLGLTVDQYLTSTGKTAEDLRQEYTRLAQENLALEFILSRIAENEKIKVEQEEIDKTIAQAKNEEEKKALESQKYFLASLLRRQKTLDFLANL